MNRATTNPLLIVFIALLLFATALSGSISITGSSGKVVEFAGIVSASPEGLIASIQAGGDWITIPWEKIELDELKAENPEIHAAYMETTEKKNTIYLKQGVFSGKTLYPEAVETIQKQLSAPQKISLPGAVKSFQTSQGSPLSPDTPGAQKQYAAFLESIFSHPELKFSSVYDPTLSSMTVHTNIALLFKALDGSSLHGRRAAFYTLVKYYDLLKPLQDTLLVLHEKRSEIVYDPRHIVARLFELKVAEALEAFDALESMSPRDQETHETLVHFVKYMEKI